MKPIITKTKLFKILIKFAAKLSAMPQKSWDEVAKIMIAELERTDNG